MSLADLRAFCERRGGKHHEPALVVTHNDDAGSKRVYTLATSGKALGHWDLRLYTRLAGDWETRLLCSSTLAECLLRLTEAFANIYPQDVPDDAG